MKTLLFTIEYPPFHGGVASYYGNMVASWPDKDGISVLDNSGDKLISKSLPILKWLPSFWNLIKEVKKNNIDHILVGQILPLGLPAFLTLKITGKPYSVILHGMDLEYAMKTARKEKIAGLVLRNAEKIICANSFIAQIAGEFLGSREKISVVNPGVGDNHELKIKNYEFRKKFNLENKIIFLSVGRLVKRKGFDKVIECLPEVLKQMPESAYVIVGKGEELDNLKLRIKNYELTDKVIITEADDNEKQAWYEACDVFIMPSRNIAGDLEGFGIVYLEANLAGKPVIAGDSGGVRDAVENGLNGLLVDPDDKADITLAIIKLAKDKEMRERLGTQGKERALKEFGWKGQAEKVNKIISNS